MILVFISLAAWVSICREHRGPVRWGKGGENAKTPTQLTLQFLIIPIQIIYFVGLYFSFSSRF